MHTVSRPFSHLVGCELNRTRHPSRSSLSRYAATALTAFAVPEIRWCQAESKGLFHILVVINCDTSLNVAHGLGDSVLQIRWHKGGVQSLVVVERQSAILAHRLWPNFKQSICSHRMAVAPEECDNTPEPVCALQISAPRRDWFGFSYARKNVLPLGNSVTRSSPLP